MSEPRLPNPSVPVHTNRLARETSPYLLQHAHNPVDWYAWGPEAFEAARAQDKPIFLSVGYSTCYWCHVMERQSFEVEAIAAEMNGRFINVKVDREERPDVDQLYMTAVQVLTHHGGWPMSVFLTPDLRPFYGGTYFPPTDAHGRPGFVSILNGIDDAYRNRKGDVEKSANQLVTILQRLAEPQRASEPIRYDEKLIEQLIEQSTDDYEPRFGGFGNAPKFPRETLLELLLVYIADEGASQEPRAASGEGDSAGAASAVTSDRSKIASGKSKIRQALFHTLDAMAHGGIRDQLGGGFHRYSTDAKWLVPHFEIMLYDNAMLGWCYAEAYRQTRDARYAAVARGVFDFILREMTSPDGAFYTALDAEVDAQEGMPYLWTQPEIEAVLTPEESALFNRVYGVDRGPNFADPHHGSGTPDKNVLYVATPTIDGSSALLDLRLAPVREKLYAARRLRKQPLLDTKIITSWNALMIRALSHGGAVLGEARYVEAAKRAAGFLWSRHRKPDGALVRTTGGGSTRGGAVPHQSNATIEEHASAARSIPGFLDDYAYFAQALLALSEAGAGDEWKDRAATLSDDMAQRFGDRAGGGFYFTDKDARDLIIRQKVGTDSPLPSGNAIATIALLELGRVEEARRALAAFAQPMQSQGAGMSAMLQAALLCMRRAGPFTVSPDDGAETLPDDRPLTPQQIAAGVVTAQTEWRDPLHLFVRVNILRGFHINAHDPQAGDIPLIPTTLSTTDPAQEIAKVEYPPGEEQNFGFTDRPIRVYSGEIGIAVHFRKPQIGTTVRLSLRYQACDDTACLPPTTKAVDAPR